jgi:hypothetical protein
MNNPSQMKRDHTPSPDKGRAGEGLAAVEETNARYKLNRLKPPSIPPCQGGRQGRRPKAGLAAAQNRAKVALTHPHPSKSTGCFF